MNTLSYAGTFKLAGDSIIIADPYVNKLSIGLEKIPFSNGHVINVDSMMPGVYEAYHLISDTGIVLQLIALHESYRPDQLQDFSDIYLGEVSSSLGNGVVITDSLFYGDSTYCYYKIMKEAYYSGKRVLDSLPLMPYSKSKKEKLEDVVRHCLEAGKEPTGADLMDVIGADPIWSGFKEFKDDSSQWSQEIVARLSYAYTNCVAIKGGIASKAESANLACSCCRDEVSGACFCISISLIHSL